MSLALTVLAFLLFVGFVALAIVSRREVEHTAARRSLILALVFPLFLLTVAWVPFPLAVPLGWLVLTVVVLLGFALLIPTGKPQGFVPVDPQVRIDERTIMFSRAALDPETEKFASYYELYPEHREPDDHFRKLPGLMSDQAGKYEPLSFAAAAGSFEVVKELAGLVSGNPVADKKSIDPVEVSHFLRNWAMKLGAEDAGIAAMKESHFYSIKGRGADYGQEIQAAHPFGVAFTVEMDHGNLGTAPEGPTLMESAQQYLNAGAIAAQIAVFIRELGYEAEAHIDGNYKVICPLVCRDAGLGEIGRMGLLMTPKLGPRVRLAVVTTDLPLIADKPSFDSTVLEFCSFCRKCADICPVDAIPTGDQSMVDGVPRWQIDSEACYTYWCAVGTDCGQCMKVCPYSHPDTLLHNLVRRGMGRSVLFRKFALRMDDFLYGRKPQPLPTPDWIPRRKSRI